jgi:tetratricopeptide (TPR) repeat protein
LSGSRVGRSTRQPVSLLAGALLLVAASVSAGAQAPNAAAVRLRDSAIVLISSAYRAGDDRGLATASALLERGLSVAPDDPWLLHYAGFALYRRATLSMGRERADPKPMLEKAGDYFERSAAGRIPESHALRSAVLGMMIGSNPLKGMTLGPRSNSETEKAVELGPDNPRVWLVRGIGAMNTPAMFGGGLGKAEEYLKKSITLFATDTPQHPAPSWGRHEAHIWLGQVYAKQDRVADARAEYQKALAIEPDDQWVKTILLPALDRKRGSGR